MEKILWSFKTLAQAEQDGAIVALRGDWRPLSNFWFARVDMYGVTFPTNEHAFAAAKCANAGSEHGIAELKAIAALRTPADAKKAGRHVKLRDDWERPTSSGLLYKEWVMLTLLRRKFAQEPMRAKLLATQDRLILEGNTWGDRTWGVIDTTSGVEGYNRLGLMLMCVREELGGAPMPLPLIPPSLRTFVELLS